MSKTANNVFTLKDSTKYTGQGVVKSKTAVGFGYYQKGDNTYMGQWIAGLPAGWGLFIQKATDGSVSAFRGMFANGVPTGAGTGWNWDKTGKLTG